MNKDAITSQEEEEEDSFFSLRTLLESNDVATLATAIEKEGIYHWDRFGRFVRADEESQEKALRLLANVYEYESNVEKSHEQHPLDISSGLGDPFSLFGWRRDTLPNFEKIEFLVPKFSKPLKASARKAPDRFIAALLRLVVELAKRDPDINIESLPGTKKDLFDEAIRLDPEFGPSFATFESYIKSFLKFRPGSHSSDYYKKLFQDLNQSREKNLKK